MECIAVRDVMDIRPLDTQLPKGRKIVGFPVSPFEHFGVFLCVLICFFIY